MITTLDLVVGPRHTHTARDALRNKHKSREPPAEQEEAASPSPSKADSSTQGTGMVPAPSGRVSMWPYTQDSSTRLGAGHMSLTEVTHSNPRISSPGGKGLVESTEVLALRDPHRTTLCFP